MSTSEGAAVGSRKLTDCAETVLATRSPRPAYTPATNARATIAEPPSAHHFCFDMHIVYHSRSRPLKIPWYNLHMLTRYGQKHAAWIDLVAPTPAEVRGLMQEFGIDPLIAEELLVPSFKPKVERRGDIIYVILHFPVLRGMNQRQEQEIDFVIGKNFLITTRYGSVDPLHAFAQAFEVTTVLGRPIHPPARRPSVYFHGAIAVRGAHFRIAHGIAEASGYRGARLRRPRAADGHRDIADGPRAARLPRGPRPA